MKKLEGYISFHVSQTNEGPVPYVRVVDKLSGCAILEAKLTLEDYVLGVLTARHEVPCQIEWNKDGPIGKNRETKEEIVWVPKHYDDKKKSIIAQALKPFEVDGWKGRVEDCFNPHKWVEKVPPEGKCHVDGNWYRVIFVRWVEE